jgi:hypothetical protein
MYKLIVSILKDKKLKQYEKYEIINTNFIGFEDD